MKRKMIAVLKLCISGSIAVVILSLFCFVYNYTGPHVTNKFGDTDYKWEAHQFFSTMKEGLSWFQFDKNGFNNVNDKSFEEEPIDILLMGSSHMEAVQVGKKENVGYLLNEQFEDLRTYNIGISGHTFYTCVQNLKDALKTYQPEKYIILEMSEKSLSKNNMRQVMNHTYPEIISYDSGLLYTIQRTIPAAKLIYKSLADWKNVSAWKTESKKKVAPPVTNNSNSNSNPDNESYEDVLNKFLDYMADLIPKDCKMIIFYQPETYINLKGEFSVKTDKSFLSLFQQLSSDYNILFVDVTKDFEKLYEDKKILAHGFSNTAVGVGHLNKYGHQVIAERLSKVIQSDMEVKKDDTK